MPISAIDDEDDPRLTNYRSVPDARLLEDLGLFVAEGRLVVRRLLASTRYRVQSVLVTPPALEALSDVLDDRSPLPILVVSQALMNSIAGFNIHRGCLALGVRRPPEPLDVLAGSARLLVALERVANADNVGAVFRNAAAFGAGGVVLDPATTDPLYRKAIRTSMGAALLVPFARAAAWPDALAVLHAHGLTVVGLTPSADAAPLPEAAPPLRGRRLVLLAGHEGEGLTGSALARCDLQVRVPMASSVDSLNVATAVAVAMYELARQSGYG